jgi:hypothetical protein
MNRKRVNDMRIFLLLLCTLVSQAIAAEWDTLWTKTIGDTGIDYVLDIDRTRDGGYILTGGSTSFSEKRNADILIMKLDSLYRTQWQKTYGGSPAAIRGQSVLSLTDGRYAVLTNVEHTSVLIVDSLGDSISNTAYFGSCSAGNLSATDDGGFVACAECVGSSTIRSTLIKYDSTYQEEWVQEFEGRGSKWIEAVGNNFMTGSQGYFYSLSKHGTINWRRKYEIRVPTASNSYGVFINCLRPTLSGGYVLCGASPDQYYFTGIGDWHLNIWVALVDKSGKLLKEEIFGQGGKPDEKAIFIEQTPDSGFLMCTQWSNATWGLYKLDKNLEKTWEFHPIQTYQIIRGVMPIGDGTYIAYGTKIADSGSQDIWLIKLGPKPGTTGVASPAGLRVRPALPHGKPSAMYTITGRRIERSGRAGRGVYLVPAGREGMVRRVVDR